MDEVQKISRHFTVVVRRKFQGDRQDVFDAWIDRNVRAEVLGKGRYKNGVKSVEPCEGGKEHFEDRWKNQLIGETTRNYIVVRRPEIIIAHVKCSVAAKTRHFEQVFSTQELLLFKSIGENQTEIVASSQIVSLKPSRVQSAETAWEEAFDAFEDARITVISGDSK